MINRHLIESVLVKLNNESRSFIGIVLMSADSYLDLTSSLEAFLRSNAVNEERKIKQYKVAISDNHTVVVMADEIVRDYTFDGAVSFFTRGVFVFECASPLFIEVST